MQLSSSSAMSTYALSTMLFASAMSSSAVTATPLWSPPVIEPKPTIYSAPLDLVAIAETNIGIARPIGVVEFVAPKARALKTLASYDPDFPLGDTSIRTAREHIEIASQIIDSLPAGIPIPWVNRNDDGEVGLYWDDDDAYADIDIDGAGAISFFSKLRSTGVEEFIADLQVEDFTHEWAYRNLALLSRENSRAAS